MNRRFRFGVQKGEFDDPSEIAAYARLVEELGYDELFSYDHVGAEDPFVPLLVAAGATDTLRVGPLVLNNELHHPVLLARTAATLDRMTGGRPVLGLGTGYAQAEHDAIGVPLRPPAARVDRFAESLQVVRSLLDDGTATVSGAHHRIALDDLGTPPVQSHVPVLIGGHGRRLVGVAARHADIFQFTGLTHARDGTPQPAGFGIAAVTQRARWLTEAAGARDDHIREGSPRWPMRCGTADPGRPAVRCRGRPPRDATPSPTVPTTPSPTVPPTPTEPTVPTTPSPTVPPTPTEPTVPNGPAGDAPVGLHAEASGFLVGPTVFKTDEPATIRLAGSIPVRLRETGRWRALRVRADVSACTEPGPITRR